jgi:hypothetical protein
MTPAIATGRSSVGWQAVKWTPNPGAEQRGGGRTHKQEPKRAEMPDQRQRGGSQVSLLDDGGGCVLLLAAAGEFCAIQGVGVVRTVRRRYEICVWYGMRAVQEHSRRRTLRIR